MVHVLLWSFLAFLSVGAAGSICMIVASDYLQQRQKSLLQIRKEDRMQTHLDNLTSQLRLTEEYNRF